MRMWRIAFRFRWSGLTMAKSMWTPTLESSCLPRVFFHQTFCPDTPPQKGVAERKNHHVLEVVRLLMYTTNVPKFLGSKAVMTATYLINQTPSMILGMRSPCELLFGENKFVVPPKLFGSNCIVRDHRPSFGKLDPPALKCVFMGYSSSQQGYKWCSPLRNTCL